MKKLLLYATALIFLASCVREAPEAVAEQGSEPATSGEQRAVEAFNSFVSHLNSDPATRSAEAVAAAPRVVGIRKANTLDYVDGGAKTRSAEEGAEVYELELLNPDTTVGYAVVGDEDLANEVFAYSPVGSITDTTYNEGLALYFRELAMATAAIEEPETPTRGLFGNEHWEDDYDALEHFYETSGSVEFIKQTTASDLGSDMPPLEPDLSVEGFLWPRFAYAPVHDYSIDNAYVPTKWAQWKPYNRYVDKFVLGDTIRKSTGCYAVALGQIMAYHEQSLFDYDWDLMTNKPAPETEAEKNEVARLLWDLAQRGGTTWNDPYTTSGSTNRENAVENINFEGYSANQVKLNAMSGQAASSAVILEEIRNHHRPIMYGAGRDSLMGGGHIWIIDAILEQYRWYYWKEFTNTPTSIVIDIYRQLKKGRLHHCNWGWAGLSDGWFFDFSSVHLIFQEYNYADASYHKEIFLDVKFVGQI